MEKIVLYHTSKDIVEYPKIRKSKYTKDFSWGFYCTKCYAQAKRWATRGIGTPVINKYIFTPKDGLSILRFSKMSDEWIDFIASCRNGEIHNYDIVEGPMFDDTVWNYVNIFLRGKINREQFWSLAKFKHPVHQMSFHTLKALDCLSFEGSVILDD